MSPRDITGLSVVSPERFGTPSNCGRVTGVLLAAGTSSRFGDANKLLAMVDSDPLVYHAARTLLASAVDRTIVVVGYEADRVRGALNGLDVDVIKNDNYHQGQATSIRTGIRAICDGTSAAIFALGDMPAVMPGTVDHLINAYCAGIGDTIAAAYEGDRGNPVLFDAHYFDRLVETTGDTGGRHVFLESDDAVLIETGDRGVILDVDTPEALDRVT